MKLRGYVGLDVPKGLHYGETARGGVASPRSVRSYRGISTDPEAEVFSGIFRSRLGFGGAGHERLSGNFRVDSCYQSAWRKFWQGFQP